MKLEELYSEYFANYISRGNLVAQDKISLLGLRSLFDRFLTHDWITKVWVVRAFPVTFEYNATDLIRSEMFSTNPEVRTIIHTVSEPVNINVRNSIFMRQFDSVANRYHELDEYFSTLSEDKQLTGFAVTNPQTGKKTYITQKNLQAIKDEYDSYYYIYEQCQDGHKFTNTYYFIQASARNKKQMRSYVKNLELLLDKFDIYYSELHGNISNYLDNFCPASYLSNGAGKFTSMLMTDENLVGLLPTRTMGLIGGEGILMGMDNLTNLPFLLNFFGSGTAQVNLVAGKTGCGKTFASFAIALGLAGIGLHFSAIDIKGNEWSRVQDFVKTLIIGMGDNNAKFVNTLRLDDMECIDEEDALEAYNTAIRGTVKLFEIAVNLSPQEGNVTDLLAILNRAVTKVYSTLGVKPNNASTFDRTKGLVYADVIDVVANLRISSSYTEQQKKLCQLIITRTSDYFLPEGRYAAAFQNELTLAEVLNSEAVIYDFNKNADIMLDTLDTLRVFMVQFLDGKKQAWRKKRKLHTAAFYEELQRCEKFGILVDEISHKVTGSRSSNVIIFLLLNSIATLESDAFAAIKSNITTKIIGKMETDDLNKLVEHFDCGPIADYMYMIGQDKSGDFEHCFAIQYDTGLDTNKLICRTVMPAEMAEHFRTRDTLETL